MHNPLKPCICGANKQSIECVNSFGSANEYFVSCWNCAEAAPRSFNKKEAGELWNKHITKKLTETKNI